MAAATDSTPVPSRRAFLAHAAMSGVAATQPPIFTLPPVADAALLALGPIILGLAAARDAVAEFHAQVEERAFSHPSDEAQRDEADAEAAYDIADGRVLAISRELAAMRATTLDGLIFKAKMIKTAGNDDAITESIVGDLLAMA